jgi:predicted ATPase
MWQRPPGPFLRKLSIRNYKSIAACQVSLKPLTVLVGRNGSGKSNFLDALHFVSDALLTSLDHALKSRGGIADVRRRSTGHPINFAIKLEIGVTDYRIATFGFEIAAREKGGFAVKSEQLDIRDKTDQVVAHYHRDARTVTATINGEPVKVIPPVVADRLYLVTAAGLPEFRPAYDGLLAMGFYNLNPEAMKELQSPDAGEILHGDGSNIASVIARLSSEQPDTVQRVKSYLSSIIPGIENFERISLGPRETIQFGQKVQGAQHPWRFYASSMSDGTLRALGSLVAVTQFAGAELPVQLVALEEPETALHPAAAGALMEALREATPHTQVLVTSHSPDLLDQLDLPRDGLLVVASENGNSRIASPDPASVEAIRLHLYTPGEMLRMDQLQPDPAEAQRQEQQSDLFDELFVAAL